MKKSTGVFITCLLAGLLANASTVSGIHLPDRQEDWVLQGAGLLRKGYIFKVYLGALYLKNPDHVRNVLSNVPKRIDIYYFHHIPKKYMLSAAHETLQKNLTAEQYNMFLPNIEALHNVFRDGKKGSRASIWYSPGEGLTYAFDDQAMITIPGDDFANAYFTIWLGDSPSSRAVKEAMLSGGGDQE